MYAVANSLMIFGCAALGGLAIWTISKMRARRRNEDAEFRRELLLGGKRLPTEQRAGVHAIGLVSVGQLQARMDKSTAEIPIVQRMDVSSNE